ncbi:MAG: gamma-glutamyl-gamma-aminobutyrate hydrolase family protein [Pseudomonadota bacterium]
MRIGILETGKVNPALVAEHGPYAPMFERLLGGADPSFELPVFSVIDNEFPETVHDCDAWLVTGSKHGVYENLPWMERLKVFLRDAYAAEAPIIGVCFGHQILAEALGGKVVKSGKGWGAGLHRYEVSATAGWMPELGGELAVHAMHQDQVISLPDDAEVIARSEFCEFAALAYGGIDAPRAISIQPHPEFEEPYERALIELRRGDGIPEEVADPALQTLGAPTDNSLIADWFAAFLRQARARRRNAA